jgi:hypothetical protein
VIHPGAWRNESESARQFLITVAVIAALTVPAALFWAWYNVVRASPAGREPEWPARGASLG